MAKPKRTRWLPAGWGIICSHKLDGNGWRFEASISGEIVAGDVQFRTNAEATRAAKRALRAYAYERLRVFAGQKRYHAAFRSQTLCGASGRLCGPSVRYGLGDVDCLRCRAILNAIEAEAEMEEG